MQLDQCGMGLESLPTSLRHRIEFFGYKQSLLTLNSANLSQLLSSFDELEDTWAEDADKKGVPELQWMTWRYKIVMQVSSQ